MVLNKLFVLYLVSVVYAADTSTTSEEPDEHQCFKFEAEESLKRDCTGLKEPQKMIVCHDTGYQQANH